MELLATITKIDGKQKSFSKTRYRIFFTPNGRDFRDVLTVASPSFMDGTERGPVVLSFADGGWINGMRPATIDDIEQRN